ncbi:MAG: hypothetical protein RL259_659 [Bacteroidota bacterium]|jgi:hypothetical protein
MGTLKEWEQKNARKLIPAVLFGLAFFVAFIYYTVSNASEEHLSDATTVEEGKQAVDYFINSWNEQYNGLCDGPRNGTTKEEFAELGENIRSISGAGEMCEKLDYELQKQVQEYADSKMEKFTHLKSLAFSSRIDCW